MFAHTWDYNHVQRCAIFYSLSGDPQSGVDCVEHPPTFSNHVIAEIAMCVELQRVNFDPKNQSWSFWSHNHETSMKMWKRALIFGRELALVTWTSTPKNESWSFWSHKHETSIKMWKRALIFGRECALVTWTSTKVATKQAFVCSRSVCVKRLT